jgi:hypothetical protein
MSGIKIEEIVVTEELKMCYYAVCDACGAKEKVKEGYFELPGDWLALRKMKSQDWIGAQKDICPECIVKFGLIDLLKEEEKE